MGDVEEAEDEAEDPLLDRRPVDGMDFLPAKGFGVWCPDVGCGLLAFGWDNTGVSGLLMGGGPAIPI